MTAKSHGLSDQCEAILEASGMTEEQIKLPTVGQPLQPPKAIVPTYKANWPVKAASHSFFEKALLGEIGGAEDEIPTSNGFDHDENAEEEATAKDGQLGEEEEEDAAGWDMGDDLNVEAESDFVNVDSAEAGAGSSDAELWARNSPLAADHVAGGSFETAMQLLNRQVGAVDFAPLKPRFLEIYQATKTYLPANAGLPPLINYVRRTIDETDSRKVLPIIPRDLETVASVDLQEAYGAMRSNKLEEGLKICKRTLNSLLVNAVSTQQQVGEAKKIISTASEYATAMALELERRSIPADGEANLKRSLELSAYFTIPKLEVAHRQLALMAAMKLAFTNKNYSSALSFANRMLANGGSAKLLDQAKKIKATCERSPQDKLDIEFDQFAEFDVCASSYTPIYSGSPSASCPFDGSKHHSQYKGKVCRVCEVCEIGAPASGIRLYVSGP
jgi:coatomer protein complex subunit alpha (xenin)